MLGHLVSNHAAPQHTPLFRGWLGRLLAFLIRPFG